MGLPVGADRFRPDCPQAVGMNVTGVVGHHRLVGEFVLYCPARLIFQGKQKLLVKDNGETGSDPEANKVWDNETDEVNFEC